MKKKILIISNNFAFPLSHGGAVAQFFFLEKLVDTHEVTYCTAIHSESEKQNLLELQERIKRIKIIYSDEIKVKRKLSLTEKIKLKSKFLIKKIFRKIFSRNNINNNVSKTIFDSFFFNYASHDFILFLKKHFNKNHYDIVQCEFFETLNLFPILPKNSLKVFVHHELRYKLLDLVKTEDLVYKDYKVSLTKQFELSLLNLFDSIVVFNDEDYELLKKELTYPELFVSPFGIPKRLIEKKEESSFFSNLLFVGGCSHYPNKEGLIWFLDTIYIPNYAEIHWPIKIVGYWSEEIRQKYEQFSNIIFLGFVKNLESLYDNSVLISPILSGSGIRTKIVQAFANKVPVISTRFASEGLFESKRSDHLIFFENSFNFMDEYRAFSGNQQKLIVVAQKGFNYFSTIFNEEKLLAKRMEIYNHYE